ncbi:IclR family transcriptional regulator [Arthrobacter sp. ATA002]|uniref:IclR family transcriptional regulator n=1 Tax=Arthrobacter sp. ATA002 TaxID=2991715 RepID=UPI0022A70DA1|nr:IclR family transcriptional regulator [Arthrobacter sp. ATA002]WAP53139.1 IclR family transcriptional regulator [Arthrobacter sp. ATA002]
MATQKPQGSTPLLVLSKVTTILDCFSIERPDPTLQDIIRSTGLPSSTCQRLVQSMLHEGFLDREGDRYRIGIGLVRWATPGTFGLDVVRLIKPVLQELRDATGETASLYIRDGAYRTIVAVAETRHVVMRPFMVGMVMPIHAGAPGKIFLAFDPEAWDVINPSETTGLERFTNDTPKDVGRLREQAEEARALGYYAAFGERHEDVGSISAPVFDHAGRLVAALGLGFPTQRVTKEDAPRLGPVVAQTAKKASNLLGYGPFQDF